MVDLSLKHEYFCNQIQLFQQVHDLSNNGQCVARLCTFNTFYMSSHVVSLMAKTVCNPNGLHVKVSLHVK